MPGCAAATGSPGHDQRVRATATAAQTRPRFSPSDRALLAALLHRHPVVKLRRFRLLVRPEQSCAGTGTCSPAATQPDLVPSVPAEGEPPARSDSWCGAWHARIPPEATAPSTTNCSSSASQSPPPPSGRSSKTPGSTRLPSAPRQPGRLPPLPGRGATGLRLLRNPHVERHPLRFGQVHFSATKRRCHRNTVPGDTNRCSRSHTGNRRTNAARTARSAQSKMLSP